MSTHENTPVFQPTEQISERTESTKTYAIGAGKYKAFSASVPLHVQNEDHSWSPVDATFRFEKESSRYISRGSRFTTACTASGGHSFISVTALNGHDLSWGIKDASPVEPEIPKQDKPETKDPAEALFLDALLQAQGSLVYRDIFPGVELRCHTDDRFKDEFIFSNASSSRPVTFHIETALHPVREEDNTIRLTDENGETAFILLPPALWDAKRTEGPVSVEFALSGSGFDLSYVPSPEFMESAVYPVTLDPVITTGSSSTVEDTYVNSASPGSNYNSSQYIYASNDGSMGIRYGLIQFTSLPVISSNHFMTRGTLTVLCVQQPGSTTAVYAREILGSWSGSTVKWSNKPDIDTNLIQDYVRISTGSEYSSNCCFVITDLVRKWYHGTNYGVALTGTTSAPSGAFFYSNNSTASIKPYLSIEYASLAGLEGYLTYDTVSAGRAGTGSVSLVNGNMVFLHNDTVMNGNRMPVSVTHVYNSCDADKNEFYLGYGWRTNLHQTLHKEYLSAKIYYVYTDGDGTEHWFKPPTSGSVYTDESGLSLQLTAGSPTTIRDKGDNVLSFPAVSGTPTASSPKTAKVLLSSMTDACGNVATITSTGLKITQVTDGAGRVTTFNYSNNLLYSIQAPWHTSSVRVSFSYSGSNLTGITYEDSKTTTYTYPSSGATHLLKTATGPEAVKATFTYANSGLTSGLPHVVTAATVTGGSLTGINKNYTYGINLCTVTDNLTSKSIRYHFNDDGNCDSVDDGLGYAMFMEYDRSGDNANTPINHPTSVSRVQRTVNNLLKDGLLCKTSGSEWTKGGTGTVTQSINGSGFGRYERKFEVTGTNTVYLRQTVTGLTAGKTYTLSGYAQSLGPKAFLRVTAGSSTFTSPELLLADCNGSLNRTEVTFTMPSGVTSASIDMCATGTGSSSSVWWDSAQLEAGETANHVNLIENGRMIRTGSSGLPDRWLAGPNSDSFLSYLAGDACTIPMPVDCITGGVLHVEGRYDRTVKAYQDINVKGNTGDRLSVGGWCSSFTREPDDINWVDCQIYLLFNTSQSSDWTLWTYGGEVNFHHAEHGWQFTCGNITAPMDYNWVRVVIYLNRQMNWADFSNLFLYKEKAGTDYVYDTKGNPTSAKSSANITGSATYDSYNNPLTVKAPGRTTATTYTWGSTAAEQKKHLLRTSTSPLGTYSTFTYDSYGNRTQSKVSASSASTAKFIQSTTAYTSNGNYAVSSTDPRGKTASQVTDANSGTLTSQTDPNGQIVSHTYDALRRCTKSATTVNSQEVRTQTTYKDSGQVATLKHNTAASTEVTYTFGYDALTRPTTVKVGTQTLSTTAYHATKGTVSSVTYGNNGKAIYSYDDFNRLTGVKFDSETSNHFTYGYDAQGQVGYVKDTVRNTVAQTEYDLAGRPLKKTQLTGTSHSYTGELAYNAYELVSKFTESVGTARTKYTTSFAYDTENKPTTLTYGTGSLTYTWDTLNRITKRSVKPGSTAIDTTYTYITGGHGTNSTTPLVQTLVQGGVTLTYTYDDNGNITSVCNGTKTTSYVYDALNQLIRVNDQTDTSAATTGTTWVYTYDLGGNILTKKSYAYTTGTVGTEVSSHSYTYGDSNWKDKLTKYDSTTISYDVIGNPTGDGTWTYTWQHGRQLKQMSKTGTTVQFEYNEDGLRTKKTVGSTVTNYILHGTNIVHMTKGSDTLHFYYDAHGKPAIVIFNGTAYGYLYNLQGDVVALVNTSGTKVVEYTYDAWGNVLTKTGSLASTLGTVQPFRYRGYVYDEETELYYLRSRYYKSKWNRFLNADSLVRENLFCYCRNNTIIKVDRNGFCEEEEIYIDGEEAYLAWIVYAEAHATEVKNIISSYSSNNNSFLHSQNRCIKVSALFQNFDMFINQAISFRSPGDSGCAMFIRAGILNKKEPHSDDVYHAGASSMFNDGDLLISGTIYSIGGKENLIPGMILGTQIIGTIGSEKYCIEHVGVYAGIIDLGKGPEPAVYSFNTDNNVGNLLPFSANNWVYYGWHKGIICD